MFSCCFQTTQVTGHKKKNRKGCGCSCSHRVYSCLQQLWPCTRKKAKRKSQGENASVSEDQRERCRESRISADTLQKLVDHLVPSLQGGDPFFVPAFLSTYRRFATPLQVLNLLCKRYEHFSSNNEEDEQVKNTFCSFLKTWMDKNPEDFWDYSDLLPLKYLKTFLSMNMPDSDLIVHVNKLLIQLQTDQYNIPYVKDEEDLDMGSNTSSQPEFEGY